MICLVCFREISPPTALVTASRIALFERGFVFLLLVGFAMFGAPCGTERRAGLAAESMGVRRRYRHRKPPKGEGEPPRRRVAATGTAVGRSSHPRRTSPVKDRSHRETTPVIESEGRVPPPECSGPQACADAKEIAPETRAASCWPTLGVAGAAEEP